MTEEEKNNVKSAVEKMRSLVDNIECMLQDYEACKSDTSKKYLGAAILKIASPLVQKA